MSKVSLSTNEISAAPSELPVLHPDALPGWIGALVRALVDCMGVHPAIALVQLLLRLAVQFNSPFVKMGYEQHRTVLNAAIVNDGPRTGYVTVKKIFDLLFEDFGDGVKFMSGPIGCGKDLLSPVLDERLLQDRDDEENFKPHKPIRRKQLLVHDEHFALTLDRVKKKDGAISYTFKKLFDDYSAKLPINTQLNDCQVTNGHVNILSHISLAELTPLLPLFQGPADFADRFMWLLIGRQPLHALPTCIPEKDMRYFRGIVAERIESAEKLGEVKLSRPARALWEKEFPALTMDVSGAARSVLGLSEVHCIRLALTYALAAGHKKLSIQAEDVRAALALMRFTRDSALNIFNGCPVDKRKVKILDALLDAPNNAMTLTAISNEVFQHNLSSDEIGKALDSLEFAKQVQITRIYTGGAPRTIVMLTPPQSSEGQLAG